MITHSIQISDLLPETFVKIILNNGKRKYGFLFSSTSQDEQLVFVSRPDATENVNDMSIEMIDAITVASIDPYMK